MPTSQGFQIWVTSTLCHIAPLRRMEQSSVSLVRKLSMLEESLAPCFPLRREWTCERNTAYLSVFSWMRNITFVQNGSIQVNGRRTLSLVRTLSMLEIEGSNILFPCEKRGNMWKECLQTNSVSKWRIGHCLKTTCFRWIGETPVAHGTVQCVRGKSVFHLVFLWELSSLQKVILPTTEGFHVGGASPLCQIPAFEWREEALSLLKENH
jgi:hypothetical protein